MHPSSRANIAAKVRRDKQLHPEKFCQHPKCLWKIVTPSGPNPCRNHPVKSEDKQCPS